jgi:hypothetical protein
MFSEELLFREEGRRRDGHTPFLKREEEMGACRKLSPAFLYYDLYGYDLYYVSNTCG